MNIKRFKVWLVGASVLLACFDLSAEIVVITNSANPIETLTRKQVVDLYMGRHLNFPDGNPALPIDQTLDSEIRSNFYQSLVGKSVAEINAYWARLLFTGRSSPPRVVHTPDAVLKIVNTNPQALAYVDAANIEEKGDGLRIKIVFRLNNK